MKTKISLLSQWMKKSFNINHHIFIIKVLENVGLEDLYLKTIKTQSNIFLSGEKL